MEVCITPYSIVMTILWSNIFFIIVNAICHSNRFIINYGASIVIILILLMFCRLFIQIDVPFCIVIPSKIIYPKIVDLLGNKAISIHSFNLSVLHIFVIIWVLGILINFLVTLIKYLIFTYNVTKTKSSKHTEKYQSIVNLIYKNSYNNIKFIDDYPDAIPYTIGFIRPIIVIPESDYTVEELHYIIMHELIHFRHKDAWIKLVLHILISLFWWNPLIYLHKKDIYNFLEVRCDLDVVKNINKAQSILYLNTLISVLKKSSPRTNRNHLFATGLINDYKDGNTALKQRFELVLQNNAIFKKHNYLFFALSVLLIILSYIFIIQPRYDPIVSNTSDNIIISPDTTYILKNGDGTYALIVDQQNVAILTEEEAKIIQEIITSKEN